MTDFLLQRLFLPDCERQIERNYYDWGRERRSKTEWVDPEWDAATPEQRRRTSLRGYALYDGCVVPQDNQIGALDAWVSVGFRSRVIELDVVRLLARAERAVPYLEHIPPEAMLEHATNEQIEAAASLIAVFTDAYQLSWGKVTKILHKKRPSFLPVLDSVVRDYVWKNFPHVLKQASPLTDVLGLCRTILCTRHNEVETIRVAVHERGFALTPLRTLDWLLWIGWRGHVDNYGLGRPIPEIWDAPNLAQAKERAALAWNES